VIIASKRENVHYGKEQMHLRVTCIFLQAEAICVRSVSVQWRRLHGARGARAPPPTFAPDRCPPLSNSFRRHCFRTRKSCAFKQTYCMWGALQAEILSVVTSIGNLND